MAEAQVALACDRCGCVRATHEHTIERLRELLVGVGWLCRTGVDVCPTCRGRKGF